MKKNMSKKILPILPISAVLSMIGSQSNQATSILSDHEKEGSQHQQFRKELNKSISDIDPAGIEQRMPKTNKLSTWYNTWGKVDNPFSDWHDSFDKSDLGVGIMNPPSVILPAEMKSILISKMQLEEKKVEEIIEQGEPIVQMAYPKDKVAVIRATKHNPKRLENNTRSKLQSKAKL